MATVFLDSSALFRRYFQAEPGANRVRELCAPSLQNALLMARIAPVEIASAFARRVREGSLPRAEATRRTLEFRLHWRHQYRTVEATDAVYALAERLVSRYALRALDALQLASALALVARSPRLRLRFWTADRQQASAARAENLDVELVA